MWVSSDNQLNNREVDASVKSLFSSELTGAISIQGDTSPWIFTAYLAIYGNRIWFTSQETTRHAAMIRENASASVALWHAPISWGDPLIGIQLRGKAKEALSISIAEKGLGALHQKFPGTIETLPDSSSIIGDDRKTTMFYIDCTDGGLRDEPNFGKGRYLIEWQ